MDNNVQQVLQRGAVIPAHPLALDVRPPARRAAAAGAEPLLHCGRRRRPGRGRAYHAVRDPRSGSRPVPSPCWNWRPKKWTGPTARRSEPLVRVAGICGRHRAGRGRGRAGPRPGLPCRPAEPGRPARGRRRPLLAHCRAVAEVMPLVGFYLQPAVGGRVLPYALLAAVRRDRERGGRSRSPRSTATRPSTWFARVAESGRDDIALYTGNDDNIVVDLLTPYRFAQRTDGRAADRRRAAGPLGRVDHGRAVELLDASASRLAA